MTTDAATRLAALAADCDAYAAEESARHFGDRETHYVIDRSGAIVLETPESEDADGNRCPTRRTMVEAGAADTDLGREYHLRSVRKADAYDARDLVCFGF